MDVRAAIDVVGDAGDVARLLAAEEGDEVGDVVDVAAAAGIWATSCALRSPVSAPPLNVGFDEAGSDGVDRHTVRPQLSGQRTGEPSSAAFAAEYAQHRIPRRPAQLRLRTGRRCDRNRAQPCRERPAG